MANTTRVSLIVRIRDVDDAEAWSQFVDLYGPLLYRYGRRKGLQDSDAADLMQEVMREVSNSIGRFEYDPSVGDPDSGIAAGTAFEDIADDWVCPVCGATKDMFEPA